MFDALQTGQFQLLEQGAMTPASMVMYQVNTEGMMVSAFDISDTHQCMTFGDTGGLSFCRRYIYDNLIT